MDILRSNSPDSNPEKRCTGPCGRTLPATPEYFHRHKDSLQPQCKVCRNEAGKAYYRRPEVKERLHTWQEAYNSRPGMKEHRQAVDKAYRSRPEIQEHQQTRMKAYRQRPEVRKHNQDYHKARFSRPEVREHWRAYYRDWSNRPEVRERSQARKQALLSIPGVREQMLAYKKAYWNRPENRERWRVYGHTRRARKRAVSGTHTPQQIREQYDRQRGKCYYCSKKVKWGEQHVDHVIPLSRGGSNDISNLVIACAFCNRRKHNKLPHEFFEGGRLL